MRVSLQISKLNHVSSPGKGGIRPDAAWRDPAHPDAAAAPKAPGRPA